MCEFGHFDSEWITVQHDVTGGETEILATSLPAYQQRGWRHVGCDELTSTALVSTEDSEEEPDSEPEFVSAEYEGE